MRLLSCTYFTLNLQDWQKKNHKNICLPVVFCTKPTAQFLIWLSGVPFVYCCFLEKDQVLVMFFSRACWLQHLKDGAAVSRRSFLEVCSGVAGGFDRVWIQPLWETGCISSSCWGGRFSSQWHQSNSTEALDVWITESLFFSPLWKQSTNYHSHLRKRETYRSFHKNWFNFLFIHL